jgi:serine/threonine protein kinase
MVIPVDLNTDLQIQYIFNPDKKIDIPTSLLPKQYIDGTILVGGTRRCSIEYKRKVNRGGHGNITRIVRSPSPGSLCIKSPHKPEYSLTGEAVLQWIASKTLKDAGIYGAVPHIYDIFQYAGETRFSMDFIDGKSAVQTVAEAEDADTIWLQILAQVSLVLGFLEEKIFLDHRDLKADNLWIRPTPVNYSLNVGGRKWRLEAPFQVVILDFGFACLGGADGNAVVSLSDGILPSIDPCPKEGRDLFQLIASMWSIPLIRNRASEEIQRVMEELLAHKKSSYLNIVMENLQTHWIYMAVSDRSFRHPPLHPVALLLKLKRDWPIACLYQE